jgi:hypothetical protein
MCVLFPTRAHVAIFVPSRAILPVAATLRHHQRLTGHRPPVSRVAAQASSPATTISTINSGGGSQTGDGEVGMGLDEIKPGRLQQWSRGFGQRDVREGKKMQADKRVCVRVN